MVYINEFYVPTYLSTYICVHLKLQYIYNTPLLSTLLELHPFNCHTHPAPIIPIPIAIAIRYPRTGTQLASRCLFPRYIWDGNCTLIILLGPPGPASRAPCVATISSTTTTNTNTNSNTTNTGTGRHHAWHDYRPVLFRTYVRTYVISLL